MRISAYTLTLLGFLITQQLSANTFLEVGSFIGVDHYHLMNSRMGGGVAIADFNVDGHLDFYLTGGHNSDALYMNDGLGRFEDISAQSGIAITANYNTMGVVTADFNNDGLTDICVTTDQLSLNRIFWNIDGSSFREEMLGLSGINNRWAISAAAADVNLDGYVDLYIGNYVSEPGFLVDSSGEVYGFDHKGYQNELYINRGGTFFEEHAELYGVADTGCALAVSLRDFNDDGYPDIFIANDFGQWVQPNQLLINNYPQSGFTNASVSSNLDYGMFGMGIASGDIDADGDFDHFVTNLGYNALFVADGTGWHVENAANTGVANGFIGNFRTTGWGANFFDFDHDSDLDLFVANGYIPAARFIATERYDPDKFYVNDGTGSFSDATLALALGDTAISRGSAVGDLDGDGDLDLIVQTNVSMANANAPRSKVYLNVQPLDASNSVQFDLEGTTSNRSAIGSRVDLFDRHGPNQVRIVEAGGSHASQNSSILHFGLGGTNSIDSVSIFWPSLWRQPLTNIPANRIVEIIEYQATDSCFVIGGSIFSSQISSSSARLNWVNQNSNLDLIIRGKRIGTQEFTTIRKNPGFGSSLKVNRLIPSTSYVWQMRYACSDDPNIEGLWSKMDTFTTSCAAPVSLLTDSITSTSARLSWRFLAPNNGSQLWGKKLSSQRWFKIEIQPNQLSYSAADLQPATVYEWKLRTICDTAKSEFSDFSESHTFQTPVEKRSTANSALIEGSVPPESKQDLCACSELNILNDSEAIVIEVFDHQGRRLLKDQTSDTPKSLSAIKSRLPAGIYYFSVTQRQNRLICREVVVR